MPENENEALAGASAEILWAVIGARTFLHYTDDP
jgi:hypothetical protein